MEKLTATVRARSASSRTAASARLGRARGLGEAVVALHDSGELDWHYQRPLSAASRQRRETDHLQRRRARLQLLPARLPGLRAQARRRPDRRRRPESGQRDLHRDFKPGAGHLARARGAGAAGRGPARQCAWRAGRTASCSPKWKPRSGGRKLPFVLATTTGFGEVPQQAAMAAIDGDPRTGGESSSGEHRSPMLALRFAAPRSPVADSVITVRLRQDSEYRRATIGRFRLALSAGAFSYPDTGDSGAQQQGPARRRRDPARWRPTAESARKFSRP